MKMSKRRAPILDLREMRRASFSPYFFSLFSRGLSKLRPYIHFIAQHVGRAVGRELARRRMKTAPKKDREIPAGASPAVSGSLAAPALALALAGLWVTPPAGAAEPAIQAALTKISEQCPREYPAIVAPVPDPVGLAGLPDAQLLSLLDAWNPALRVSVATELGRRGEGVIQPLMEALSSKTPERRAGALDALSRMIGHRTTNWQEFRPEETDPITAQESIRKELADRLLDAVLKLARDPERDVRRAALSLISALKVQGRQAAQTVLALCADEDAYIADQASAVLGGVGLSDLEPEIVLPVFRKALKNPLPRGKGPIVQLIAKSDESFQRKLIPDLLAHLDWQPDRDTMFGASGQAEAVQLLTKLRVRELIPRLPTLMDKTMRGPGLFNDCVASAQAFGPDARALLPVLRERMAREEAALKEVAGRNDRQSRERAEQVQNRLEALRKAVAHVEQ